MMTTASFQKRLAQVRKSNQSRCHQAKANYFLHPNAGPSASAVEKKGLALLCRGFQLITNC
jgi:hypothetical protein